MTIKADMKYNGKVGPGSTFFSSQSGTPGFQVNLECEDGETFFVIWLTEKNRKNVTKYFEVLGADPEKLKNASYLEYELGMAIDGKEVSFGTKAEEYKGKPQIKVAWIGRKSEGKPAQAAAKFFSGKTEDDGLPEWNGPKETSEAAKPPEDDIPF